MIPACSALAPTMKPVTLWRKTMGVFLGIGELSRFIIYTVGHTYCWLHVRINWAPLTASAAFSTESWLAMIPTGKPEHI